MDEIKRTKKFHDIVLTGQELFLKHGVKRVTVEEICEEAKVTKGTFYKYFKNKNALAVHIADGFVELGFAKYDELNQMDMSYPEKIALLNKWQIEFSTQIGRGFIEEVLDIRSLNLEMRKRHIANIVDAQNKGEIKKDLSPELIMLVSDKMIEIVKEGSWQAISNDYQEVQRQIMEIYFSGILQYKLDEQ